MKRHHRARTVSITLLLAACSTALGVEGAAGLPAATQDLLNLYPGAQAHQDQGRVHIIYGVPMTPGLTARGAATEFIRQHGAAFGCGPVTVQEEWSADFADGSKTVFCYQQYINGLPVEYGVLKVLVMNGPVPRVVYAAGTMAAAPAPVAGAAGMIDGDAAVRSVQAMKTWRNVPVWGKPQPVVFQGNGDWMAPRVAWKFVGESLVPSDQLHRTFFVDAATGALLSARDEVVYDDVAGSIHGMGSPGVLPDASYNPPASITMTDMRASITGGNSAYTDATGAFSIVNAGTAPVTVNCGVNGTGAGRWVNVIPNGSSPITASLGVTPPGPADLMLNPAPAEALTAQVNAFAAATITHNFIKTFAPSLTRWDTQLQCNTGVSGTCNAFFTVTGSTPNINFYNSGGGCVNTAYSTVISHEFGHFIVSRLGTNGSGLAQNAFGEGYGDTNAELIWDDNVTGRGFSGPGTFVRDPIAANVQYPCSNEIHFCGQVISGIWWRTRVNMGAFYGNPQGLNLTRQLEVNWALITTGGPDSSNSAGPGTAIEVLTADDDNGNINDGTPNYSRICPAFAAHSIQCPVIVLLSFQYPSGRPAQVTPNQGFDFPVNVVGVTGSPQPGTGTLSYRVNGGSFTTVPMVQGAPNQYTASLPAVPCGANLEYYVSAQTTASQNATDPATAPTALFSAPALAEISSTTVADLNFQADPGWTVTNDPSLTTGAWQRGVPATPTTNGPPADFDHSGMCWVTDNRPETGGANFDVDGGPTTLTTNAYDLSGFNFATVSYARWIQSINGVTDFMMVQVSSDNGSTWTTLESVPNTPSGWVSATFNVPTLTPGVRFRWVVSDNPNDSVTEAGVDAFKVVGYNCSAPCYANCDGSVTQPVLTVLDFLCFQALFAQGDPRANCDGSTAVPTLTVNDFVCFQTQFALGCP